MSLRRWRAPLAAGLTLGGAAVAVTLWPSHAPAPVKDPVAAFLDTHWQRPLRAQGAPPASYSALEASLDPAACGQCHAEQHADWSQSLHAQTLSAGVAWQLRLMPPEDAKACLDCHAPLAEQKALLAQQLRWPEAPGTAPPPYVPATLARSGLVCAGCHVRAHERYGPGLAAAPPPQSTAPHGGFVPSPAFGDSRFCASCHQFEADGPRTAGKLREDTYEQWRSSPEAARGETCQSCHMPGRQHEWKGIHDPDMLRRALTASLRATQGQLEAIVTNTGGGHWVPTYLVPKITVVLREREAPQRVLASRVIGWQVDVSLQHEAFDTRLPSGASLRFAVPLPSGREASAFELVAEVAPREHYERSFEASLANAASLDAETLRLLQQARAEAAATRYRLTLAHGE